MKKFLSVLLALLMVFTLVGCGAKEEGGSEEGGEDAPVEKIAINMQAFTDEVPGMFKKFLETFPEYGDKYYLNETITATTDGLYQPALDEALQAGEVDLYAAEAAFVSKYTQGDMRSFAATYDDLGIDTAKAIADAQISDYSVVIGTRQDDNKVVALGYQATGGCFIYRRSIANAVFGSDDPAVVEEAIGANSGNWDKFFEAAEKCKAAGYKIISGDGDMWHAVENSSSTGWIVDGKLVIPAEREAFLDLSKRLKDNQYHNDTQDWQEGWFADMKMSGTALGFYGPAWLINYSMHDNAGIGTDDSSEGDWAVCTSNIGFFWGGTWLLASKDVVGSDKQDVVKAFIEWVTLDTSENGLQYKWANGTLNGEGGTKDTVASGVVMSKSNGEVAFLGGQNMFDKFVPANKYADGSKLTQYDESINSKWRDAVRSYTGGEVTRDEAIEAFKTAVKGLGLDIVVE